MAHQSDWQKAQAAFRDWQERGGRASGPPPQIVRDMMRQKGLARDADLKAKGYGPADFSDLLKPLNREAKKTAADKLAEQASATKKKPTKGEIKKALANGATLDVSTASDCFLSLSAEASDDEGMVIVTGTFRNPTRGDWQYEMSLDEFLDWANDDLGVAFNEWVRGNYEI